MNKEIAFLKRNSKTWEVLIGDQLSGILYQTGCDFDLVVFGKKIDIYQITQGGDVCEAKKAIRADSDELFKIGRA